MSDQGRIEKARTEREALDAVSSRPPRSGDAVHAALKRYLASEHYRDKPDREKSDRETPTEPEE